MSNPQRPDAWDAGAYDLFADERTRPFYDLLARVGASRPFVVVDLGCGTGSGLLTMAHRWPDAQLIGVDSSIDMLAVAATALHGFPDVTLIHADARTWSPDTAIDVLVSNALLQWIPDHGELVAAMASWLGPDGWLALQVPGNFDAPSHVLLRRLAGSPQWIGQLGGALRGADSVLDAVGYLRILRQTGLSVDAWETTYLHELSGPEPVLRWTSGTALRPVFAVLGDQDAQEFSGQYAELLNSAYPADETGRVLFPFRRIFAVARREENV
ncbi:MAG: methyltransferase domain-containing protein [Geodermatophilaceae bacterium]|nr:methyltransferase domain-containing protein [Geodermatophilaceae bacterium]MDQ3476824.1 methyltransferase domain-containing protein [Actinomycetota bacterium]